MASVSDRRRCKTSILRFELDSRCTVLLVLAVELDHFRAGRAFPRCNGRDLLMFVVCIWRDTHEEVTSYTLSSLSLEVTTPENTFIRRRCRPYIYASKSASQTVLSRMRSNLHATRPTHQSWRFALGAGLAQAIPSWAVKTRLFFVPSLWGCEGHWPYDYAHA